MSEKRKRRWWELGLMALPAIIVLTLLVALMMVGSSNGRTYAHAGGIQATREPFEHGWPFLFLTRNVYLRPASRWAIWQGGLEWNPVGVVGNAVFLVAAIVLVTVLSIRRARQNRVWRLTIRECMAITLLIGVIAAHLGWCVRRGEQALAIGKPLEALQANVDYEYCGPTWLRRIRGGCFDSALQGLHLYSIHSVDLKNIERSDMEAACRLLGDVQHPYEVTLNFTEVNEPVLQLVLESLTRCRPEVVELEYLKLEGFKGKPWSAELLEPLARNPRLRILNIRGTGIGDLELPAILQCRHLQSIDVTVTKMTAQGVQQLLALPELEEISVDETAVSAELREQAAAAGVRLEVEVLVPYSRPRINPGAGMFGSGPPDPPEEKSK